MINKKISSVISVALIAALVGGAYLYSSEQEQPQKVVAAQLDDNESGQVSKLKKLSDELTAQINQQQPLPRDGEVTTKERMLISFQRMQSTVGKFNSSSFVKAELRELLHNPETVEVAQATLLDLDAAIAEFGDEQALARVYSIKLLNELAKLGDAGPLHDTTARLAQTLNEQANQNIEFKKRQDLDLEELVHASLDTFDEQQIIDQPHTVMSELGYFDDQHEKVRKIYANMFGSVFMRHASIDESIARVQALFNKQGASNG
ncbi:hypothetical protein [Pseudoalteromonas rubra]|uniref:hypothetical protein n=1 Tax=Pseudoalteromonas rubra TaxID=43658 RepID=UPI000F788731|nr:hypothetical protein [Pseudoalteromonas rubra]